jgi:hypothetical protein
MNVELNGEPIDALRGASITYHVAVGPRQGRKVFTRQTLPTCEEPCNQGSPRSSPCP